MVMRNVSAMVVSAMLLLAGPVVQAADAPSDPKKQTPWGLYLTAQEAYEMKQFEGDEILFIDVRDPIEIMFTGFTEVVDINVPFLLSNPAKWNSKKSVFLMEKNPDYTAMVEAEMKRRGMGPDTPVLVMCRSGGTRGAPSAKALQPLGLTAVYVVVDGFEGGAVKDHPNGPWRLKNGWKNAGLPWGYKLNPDKVHFRK